MRKLQAIFRSTSRVNGHGSQQYIVKHPDDCVWSYRRQLESALMKRLGLQGDALRVFAVSKGINAIRLGLHLLRSKRKQAGGRVLLPAITAPATAQAVLMEGFEPVLVDVDSNSWQMDLHQAESLCIEDTVGIISVDWLGSPVDPDAVGRFASRNGLFWISDRAQSFGATWRNFSVMGNADVTIFSTGYPKVFHTAGRGGLLLLRSREADALTEDAGGRLRHEVMPEINAAFGLCLLASFDKMLAHRRSIAQVYRDGLESILGLRFQTIAKESESNAYQISLRVENDEFGKSAQEITQVLRAVGFEASAERVCNLARIPQLRPHVRTPMPLIEADALHDNSITLPISNHIPKAMAERICKVIQKLRDSSHC